MEIVPRRDSATLLPILNSHIAPGTVVHTDQCTMYNGVASLSNVASHDVVNHSVEFVNRTTVCILKHSVILEQI